MKKVTAQEMAEIDRKAQEIYGIPQKTLMEDAGTAVFQTILSDTPNIKNEKIAILCGKGNNGGDGFVIARKLAEKYPQRLIVFVVDKNNIREGSSLDNFKIIQDLGVDIRKIEDFLLDEDFTVLIDAIFGTGFKGSLPESISSIGEKVNSLTCKKFAVDIPSGLDATTGKASKNSLKSDKTITFGLSKYGFYIEDGPDLCGEVIVEEIGFPEDLLK
jgi:hydroxyethylthiazole kinase-like uncharacterized protein yjeF